MTRVIIHLGKEAAGQSIGLAELLDVLGERVLLSQWLVSDLNYISIDDNDIEAFASSQNTIIKGSELLASLSKLLQVIDGEFKAFDQEELPWVVLKAVDSSWWEVIAQDTEVIKAIQKNFSNAVQQ
jgi:hypothetical protein